MNTRTNTKTRKQTPKNGNVKMDSKSKVEIPAEIKRLKRRFPGIGDGHDLNKADFNRLPQIAETYGQHHILTAGTARAIENIKAIYERATADEREFDWYSAANRFSKHLAEELDFSLPAVAAIVAALSPQNPWKRNKVDARNLILAFLDGKTIHSVKVSTYDNNKRKAWRIAQNHRFGTLEEIQKAEFSGPKISAFLDNIAQPYVTDRVTVDFHAYSIAVGFKYTSGGDYSTATAPSMAIRDYKRVERAYRLAAAELDIHPQKLQAVTWIVWRRIHQSERTLGQNLLAESQF